MSQSLPILRASVSFIILCKISKPLYSHSYHYISRYVDQPVSWKYGLSFSPSDLIECRSNQSEVNIYAMTETVRLSEQRVFYGVDVKCKYSRCGVRGVLLTSIITWLRNLESKSTLTLYVNSTVANVSWC